MTLEEWVERQGFGAISDLARRSGVTAHTLHKMLREGTRLRNTRRARAISKATDRQVSTLELLDLEPEDLGAFMRPR